MPQVLLSPSNATSKHGANTITLPAQCSHAKQITEKMGKK
jgi:hypothetical protein